MQITIVDINRSLNVFYILFEIIHYIEYIIYWQLLFHRNLDFVRKHL